MCGRYQSWIEDDELTAIIERERRGNAERFLRRREVFPGDEMPVLYGSTYFIRARVVRWGYPMPKKNENDTLPLAGALSDGNEWAPPEPKRTSLVINARSETVLEKRMFREDIFARRVIVPTSGYYEWAADKQKYHIGGGLLCLAAMTHVFEDAENAVILTTEPVSTVSHIHHRMPLILEPQEVEPWLYDDGFCREKLRKGNTCLPEALAVS